MGAMDVFIVAALWSTVAWSSGTPNYLHYTEESSSVVFPDHLRRTKILPIVLSGSNGTLYTKEINNTVEYIFEFTKLQASEVPPARIMVESNNSNRSYPVMVVVQQQKGVLSWQLPLVVESGTNLFEYARTSRTLCPDYTYPSPHSQGVGYGNEVIVSVSTASPHNLNVSLLVSQEIDFSINLSEKRTVYVSPAEPRFYEFKFTDNTETVLLRVDSDDDICMTVSIQNMSKLEQQGHQCLSRYLYRSMALCFWL